MPLTPGPGFYRIPQEILDQILNNLEENAPRLGEDTYLRGQPYLSSAEDTTQPKQQRQPAHLKSLSLVSKRLRAAVLDRLFLRLQLVSRPPPISAQQFPPRDGLFEWIAELSEIAAFVRRSVLHKTVKSFVLKIVDGQAHYHVDMTDERERDSTKESAYIAQHWHQLLVELPHLERLTIIAPPFCLGVMISVPLDPWISEILYMPYQVLSLGRKTETPSNITRDDLNSNPPSLLTIGGWTSVLLNEGSFLRWYAHGSRDWEDELLSVSSETRRRLPEALRARIKSFEYIGIFPPPQSFERLVRTLSAMPSLQSFSFRVQPIGDLLYDTAQRESASFPRLQEAIQLDYNTIVDEMIAPSVVGNTTETGSPFGNLLDVQCLDQGGASLEMWQRATDGLETSKWRRGKEGARLTKISTIP